MATQKTKIEFARRTHDGDVFYTFVLLPLIATLKRYLKMSD